MAKPPATADETAQAAETAAEETTAEGNGGVGMRFPLPAGKVTPIQLKNELVRRGLAPKDIKPQQFYTFVKNPGKTDPFPVMHYDEDGIEYDKPQINDGETRAWTRPGLDLEAGVQWWERRKTRTGTSGKPGGTSGKPRGDAAVEGGEDRYENVGSDELAGEDPWGQQDSGFQEAE
jgi:hypothetical protein